MIGAKQIKLEDPQTGTEIEIMYWVSHDEYSDQIEIDTNEDGARFSVDVARKVSRAIVRLLDWAKTKAGKKRIAELRLKEAAHMGQRI